MFLKASRDPPTESDLRKQFVAFDTNLDGILSKEEVQAALRGLGYEVSEAKLNNLFNDFDHNKNGVLEFPEFSKMMTKLFKDDDKYLVEFRYRRIIFSSSNIIYSIFYFE